MPWPRSGDGSDRIEGRGGLRTRTQGRARLALLPAETGRGGFGSRHASRSRPHSDRRPAQGRRVRTGGMPPACRAGRRGIRHAAVAGRGRSRRWVPSGGRGPRRRRRSRLAVLLRNSRNAPAAGATASPRRTAVRRRARARLLRLRASGAGASGGMPPGWGRFHALQLAHPKRQGTCRIRDSARVGHQIWIDRIQGRHRRTRRIRTSSST